MLILVFCFYLQAFSWAADIISEKKYTQPVREFSIIATNEGFYPKNLVVFKGERVKIYLTATGDRMLCLSLPEKNIFISAKSGEITESLTRFEEVGEYKFHCPIGNIQGSLVVLEQPDIVREKRREVASKRIIHDEWMPKEE